MPKKIEALETLARTMIGDGQTPDLFFVTDEGAVVLIETSALRAYGRWRDLAQRSPRKECALENRTFGVIASVEPRDDTEDAPLIVCDDYRMFSKSRRAD